MNTLCHLALAGPDPEHQLGQFLGDFIKGPLDPCNLSAGVKQGLRAHRRIDAAGDQHAFTRLAKSFLPPADRRYGGIVLDLLCDWLLHQNWSRVMADDRDELLAGYHELLRHPPFYFSRDAHRYARMVVKHDLLHAYANLSEVRFALSRMGQRLKRPVDLLPLLAPLLKEEKTLQSSFPGYFEDMRREADRLQR